MSEVGRIAVRDIEMEYEAAGDGGRTFLLVHGFTGSRDDFREQMPALAGLGRTVAIDQRGHGGSTNSGDPAHYTLEQLVADLSGFADALVPEPFDLLGHSMGGMVALRYALAQPERVASLILMDTSPGPIEVFPRELWAPVAKVAREAGMGVIARGMRERATDDAHRPEASRRVEAESGSDAYWGRVTAKLEAMDAEAFATLGPMLGDHLPVVDRLGEILCPTAVLVGEQDLAFRCPSETLARQIPGAALVVVPEAAHSPQLENVAAWLDALRGHLLRARPTSG